MQCGLFSALGVYHQCTGRISLGCIGRISLGCSVHWRLLSARTDDIPQCTAHTLFKVVSFTWFFAGPNFSLLGIDFIILT